MLTRTLCTIVIDGRIICKLVFSNRGISIYQSPFNKIRRDSRLQNEGKSFVFSARALIALIGHDPRSVPSTVHFLSKRKLNISTFLGEKMGSIKWWEYEWFVQAMRVYQSCSFFRQVINCERECTASFSCRYWTYDGLAFSSLFSSILNSSFRNVAL